MANFIVTASNWNSAAFWNGTDVSGPGHTLDFSALPSNFSVDFYPAAGRILVSDGTNFFIIGDSDYGGGTDATMAGTTQLEFFTTVIGSDGNDMVDGGVNDDTVIGSDGNDTIVGDVGADTRDGGAGNDRLLAGSGGDSLDGNGGGYYVVTYAGSGTGVNVDLSDGSPESGGNAQGDTLTGIEQVDGSAFGETITTDDTGMEVRGKDGNDTVSGGAGNDSITGGNGDDVFVYNEGDGPPRVAWIGTRDVAHAELLQNERLRPVLINKGVLGAERNLLVSRQHGLLLGQHHLGRAIHLAKTMAGVRIAAGKRKVTYVHLMFEAQQIVFAEGIPSESFYPGSHALEMLSDASHVDLTTVFPQLKGRATKDEIKAAYGDTARSFLKDRKAVTTLLCNTPVDLRNQCKTWEVDPCLTPSPEAASPKEWRTHLPPRTATHKASLARAQT